MTPADSAFQAGTVLRVGRDGAVGKDVVVRIRGDHVEMETWIDVPHRTGG